MGPGEERNLLRMLRHTNRFSTLQMRAHVHVLEMRERAGAQRRQVPAVPGADRGGGPGIRGAVNYTTTVVGSFGAGGSVAKLGRKREKQDPCFFFILLFVFLSFSGSVSPCSLPVYHLTGFTLHTYISAATAALPPAPGGAGGEGRQRARALRRVIDW